MESERPPLSEKVYRISYEPVSNPHFDRRLSIGLDLRTKVLKQPIHRLFHVYTRHSGFITRFGTDDHGDDVRYVENWLINGCLVQLVHPTEGQKVMTSIFLTGEDKTRMRETAEELGLPFDEAYCFTRMDRSTGFGPEVY